MRSGLARTMWAFFFVFVGGLFSTGRAVDAAPFTTSFDALRAELQRRHDADYAGTLSRTARRELAAIDASLTRIDGAHDDVLDDVKTLRVVAIRLAGAFRNEFNGGAPGSLPALLSGAATALAASVETSLGTLEQRAAALLDPAAKDRALALAATARSQLAAAAAPGVSAANAAALLKRALTTIAKGVAAVEAGKADRLVCTMNGRVYAATGISAQVSTFQDRPYIVISATLQNPVTGRAERLGFVIRADVGVPTDIDAYTIFGTNFMTLGTGESQSGYFFSQYSPKSTLTLTGFDADNATATGTFSCYLQREGQLKLTMTKGSFRVTGQPPQPAAK